MEEIQASLRMGRILSASPFLPSVTLKEAESFEPIGDFAQACGLKSVEILLRSPHALAGVEKLKKRVPSLTVGVGTVLAVADFHRAVDAGADFIVSPGMTPELLEAASRQTIGYLPGVMTPSEIMFIQARGFRNAKLFPVSLTGEGFLKAIAGPFPDMRYCVSGGATAENWETFAKLPHVVNVSGTWIIPEVPLEATAKDVAVASLKDKHVRFARCRT